MASFMSYATEKNIAKEPERFGRGAIEGVAGPEAANSSAAIAAFIPTLTLGIPGDAVMALILGALMVYNIVPGPDLMIQHSDLFWGLVVSFWIGNAALVVLNIPLIQIWVKLLAIPYRWVFPVVMFFIFIGAYSGYNRLFEVGVVLILGVVGWIFKKLDLQAAPLVMGLILGPLIEEYMRRALTLARGDWTVFVTRPLSGGFVAATVGMLIWVAWRKRKNA